MCGDDEGDAGGVGDVAHELEDGEAGVGVEVAGRLVGKDQPRGVDEGAGDGDALLLAAGELGGAVLLAFGQADERERFAGAALALGAESTREPEGHLDVFTGGEGGDEVRGL